MNLSLGSLRRITVRDCLIAGFVILVIIILSNGLGLRVLATIRVDYLAVPFTALCVAAAALMRTKEFLVVCKNRYSIILFLMIAVVCLTNLFSGVLHYGISLMCIPYGAKHVFPVLMFIPLTVFFNTGHEYRVIHRTLMGIGVFLLILHFVGMISPAAYYKVIVPGNGSEQMLNAVADAGTSMREGRERLLFCKGADFCVAYLFLVSMVRFFRNPIKEMWYGLVIGMYFFDSIFISMTRQVLIGSILLINIYFCFYSRSVYEKLAVALLLFILFTGICVAVPSVNREFSTLVTSAYDDAFGKSAGGTGNIRKEAAAYFWQEYLNNNCIGVGMVSKSLTPPNHPLQIEGSTSGFGYFYSDLGILGMFYRYSFQGLVLTLLLCFLLVRDALAISCTTKIMLYQDLAKASACFIVLQFLQPGIFAFPWRANLSVALLLYLVNWLSIHSNNRASSDPAQLKGA